MVARGMCCSFGNFGYGLFLCRLWGVALVALGVLSLCSQRSVRQVWKKMIDQQPCEGDLNSYRRVLVDRWGAYCKEHSHEFDSMWASMCQANGSQERWPAGETYAAVLQENRVGVYRAYVIAVVDEYVVPDVAAGKWGDLFTVDEAIPKKAPEKSSMEVATFVRLSSVPTHVWNLLPLPSEYSRLPTWWSSGTSID